MAVEGTPEVGEGWGVVRGRQHELVGGCLVCWDTAVVVFKNGRGEEMHDEGFR